MKTPIKIRALLGASGLALALGNLPLAAQTAADRADIAGQINTDSRISLLTTHVSGVVDNANAKQTIVDTSQGSKARRSCYGNAPCGTTWLDPRLLHCMNQMAKTYGYTFRVTETCGGSHSVGSKHYGGFAYDVDVINGSGVSSSNPYWSTFLSRCANYGATERLGPGDAGHSTHIHAGWNDNGGNVAPPPSSAVTSPSVITRTDGKVFAFVVTSAAGDVQYRTKTGVAGSWGSWVSLSGSGFNFARGLAIDNGGCAVFGMGGGNILYKYLASSGAGVWSSWVSIPASGFTSIAPIMKTDGKMALVGCGNDTSIFYAEQTAVGPGAAWTGWTDLAASGFYQVDALPLPNGGAAAFGVGLGSGAFYKYKASSGAAWASSWANLGGSGFSRISAVMESNGRMAFFGSGGGVGSAIFYQEQSAAGATASWSGWISLGGSGFSSISGVALPNGGLAVFGCTDNGAGSSEFYKVRTSSAAAWGGYVDLGASNVRRVSATADSSGLMTTVMRGGAGAPLYERRQTDATHWAGWVNLGNTLK